MQKVNLYITVKAKGIRTTEGYWSYVLETIWKGETWTKERTESEANATINVLHLMALYRALERMRKSSRIKVYTDSAYLAGAINNNWLDAWAHNDWKTAKGEPVKNAEIWKEIWQQAMEHEIDVEVVETHAYKSWQQEQIRKAEKEAENVDFTK